MNIFNTVRVGLVILLVFQLAILSGCDQYKELTNDPPEITNFTVPTEVEYGETVQFRIRVFDPEDDSITYSWEVSEGTLLGGNGPEVQWTAPVLPPEEIVPPKTVTVHVYVDDGGDEDVSKTASIIVYSRPYRVAQALSGAYTLVSKRVDGVPVEVEGVLRLTTTTFTQEFKDVLEDNVSARPQFVTGSYKLVKPFDERRGTIHWLADGDFTPSISTYTWDGRLLVLFLPVEATQYVYSRVGGGSGGFEGDDVPIQDGGDADLEPVNTDPLPIEDVEENPEPEPVNVDPEPVEVVEELDPEPEPINIDPEPVNFDGEPIEITDATFETKVLNAALPVVVEFEADWCPFCRQMRPVVDAAALEHRNTFIIGRLDTDENRQRTEEYQIRGIPTYLVFRNGEVVARFAGAMPKEVFVQRILTALQ